MTRMYNDPVGGSPSTIGTQLRTDKYDRKALIEAAKKMYFSQLASTIDMPKHMGKTIKKYHYLPILDAGNVNDQGIDATGSSAQYKKTIFIRKAGEKANVYRDNRTAVGEGATAAAALTAARAAATDLFKGWDVFTTDYATTKAALEGLADPWVIDESVPAVPNTGNLYGSSKDVGTIVGKMPTLREDGGKVNRVGHTRIELQGTFEKFGFHDTYTAESLAFDTDEELEMHIRRENLRAATEISEDALQIDLLNAAGLIRNGGNALAMAEINGEAGTESLISYKDLQRTSIDLDENNCPKHTKVIKGSQMVDTQTIPSARVIFIGSELQTTIEGMVDQFGERAFTPIEKYAAATKTLQGEIGAIYQFRVVVVPEMMHWAGAGAPVVANQGYRETNGKYDVFPMLVVGDESFTTIGFQTGGQGNKFMIKHSKPGSNESYSTDDPYGEVGFHSIKWWYGFMALRSERIALLRCVAPW